ELVDQELEPVPERPAKGVLGEIRLDCRLVAGCGGRAGGGLGGKARLAVQEVLGDQRLRLRGTARVRLELGEAGVLLDGDERGLLRRDLEVGDRAGLWAGDTSLRPLDQSEGVEELDLIGPAVRRSGNGDQAGGRDGEQAQDDEHAPHGPTGTWFGSHSSVPPWGGWSSL